MSYNKSLFEGVPKKNPNQSRFNLSHEWKSQFSLGRLIPCLLLETMPNDEFSINSEFLFRFQSLYYPIMSTITMRCDYHYIPTRILWPYQGSTNQGWRKWISEQTEEELPYVNANMQFSTTGANNTILQFMGIPLIDHATEANYTINNLLAFPLSAYLKCCDQYYRVSQLEDERWFPLQPGDNTTAFENALGVSGSKRYNTLGSLWMKDYFTSALPTPQIGEAVQIPMVADPNDPTTYPTRWMDSSGNTSGTDSAIAYDGTNAQTQVGITSGIPAFLDTQTNAADIRQLRLAEVLQGYYERIMKIGQRYTDFIEGLFGQNPTPGLVEEPILFGSKFGRVQISDTMTTAETVNGTVVSVTGDYRGNANLYSNDRDTIHYHCREHGYILGIIQVNPNTNYGQGIHRLWRRQVQTDFPLDMFSTIGDQEILKEELVYNYLDTSTNEETFGYIPRHSEMRYQNNIFVGELLHATGQSQHLGRIWDLATFDMEDLEINEQFVHCLLNGDNGGIRVTDTFRVLPIIATGSPAQHTVFAHIYHSIYVNRNLPLYATPKL